jgi:hypothetical protein
MSERPLTAERVAALLDGRLEGAERELVLAQAAADPEWREVLGEAGAAMEEVDAVVVGDVTAPVRDVRPAATVVKRKTTGRNVLPWVGLAAAAVIGFVVVMRGDGWQLSTGRPTVGDSVLIRPPEVLALPASPLPPTDSSVPSMIGDSVLIRPPGVLTAPASSLPPAASSVPSMIATSRPEPGTAMEIAMAPEVLESLQRDRWSVQRAGRDELSTTARSVRLGVYAVDAMLDRGGGGAEARAAMMELLEPVAGASVATALLRAASDSASNARAFEAVRALVDQDGFDVGVWLELVRAGNEPGVYGRAALRRVVAAEVARGRLMSEEAVRVMSFVDRETHVGGVEAQLLLRLLGG